MEFDPVLEPALAFVSAPEEEELAELPFVADDCELEEEAESLLELDPVLELVSVPEEEPEDVTLPEGELLESLEEED